MQLTSLEIKGFKSFADKVVLRFDAGITGVIGPNGCGKSNVIDAIRWVLGEQRTKHLRSDKMSNIIFNGTAKRKAADFAEVTLHFENNKNLLPAEYKEVSITRKYARNGNGDYFLNGVACRKKDILDLLAPTGATANSYAIIELKMVDDILNDREDARKQMFEEAAGIAQFKQRKKESLSKLESVDTDLERVEDLLGEITANMNHLEKQAAQVDKYLEAKDSYQRHSIALSKRQMRTFRQNLESQTQRQSELLAEKTQLHAQVETFEQHREAIKTDIESKESTLSEQRQQLSRQNEKIRYEQTEAQRKRDREKYLLERKGQVEKQIVETKQNNESQLAQIGELSQSQAFLQSQVESLEAELANIETLYKKEKQAHDFKRSELNLVQDRVKNLQSEILVLTKEKEVKEAQQAALLQENEQLGLEFSGQEAQIDKVNTQLSELEGLVESLQSDLDQQKNEQAEKERLIGRTQQEIEKEKEEKNNLLRRYDAQKNEVKLLKTLVESKEGYSQTVQYLTQNFNQVRPAASENALPTPPLLTELLDCQPEYIAALQTFLQPFMNFFVVENEQIALQTFAHLQEAKKGKAQFFVLERLKDLPTPLLLDVPQALSALAVVRFEAKYKSLFYALLQSLYFVEEDFDPAQTLLHPQAVFIRKDTTLLYGKNGELSGGQAKAQDEKSLLIGKKQQLENLEKSLVLLEAQIQNQTAQITTLESEKKELEASSLQASIQEKQKQLNRYLQEKISAQARLEQMQASLERSLQRKQVSNEKVSRLKNSIEGLEPQIAEKQFVLKTNEEKKNQLAADFERDSLRFEAQDAFFKEKNKQLYEEKARLEKIQQETAFKENAIAQNAERLYDLEQEAQQIQQESQKLHLQIEAHQQQERELSLLRNEWQQVYEEEQAAFRLLRAQDEELSQQIRNTSRKIQENNNSLLEIQNKIGESRLKLTALQERLQAEFNLVLEEEQMQQRRVEDELSDEVLIEEIESAKRRLQRIGAINETAKEAYLEVKERHDFITSEKDDLVKAKESLVMTLAELEAEAEKSFSEAFTTIRQNFIAVFRSLFSDEDNCDLKLLNPQQPLDSPIEILAQPKGKRPLTIKQLSGGEKTLTAVALLFSIYLYKPAPFCIFDEVDAPLDDANIDKFTRIIQKFSKEVQFIVVTHNKRTMVSTDVVYGVTMPEIGVSRAVPVSLKGLAVN
ncbi:chromosome segregation protein SMC [Hugenholtzia roseola]|uniref:chromosome segregation protein SMC n=1 Tax=Hugenholtzia roseola TaxID=1002 RepID=UPI0004168DD4|nr:chromosome segregation protein SMC [Hugenholtzia roseola]